VKTLSISHGRQRLGYWLKKALDGEDIGFAFEGKVVALRPVEIYSDDYALREYGATPEALERFAKRADKEIAKARAKGQVKPFTGKL
jgi:hypothetical protein